MVKEDMRLASGRRREAVAFFMALNLLEALVSQRLPAILLISDGERSSSKSNGDLDSMEDSEDVVAEA